MILVFEGHIRPDDVARALHIDILGTVDHHLGQGVVGQQRFQRTIAQDLGHDRFEQALTLSARQDNALLGQDCREQLLDRRANLWRMGIYARVKLGQQLVLDPYLQILVVVGRRRCTGCAGYLGHLSPFANLRQFRLVSRFFLSLTTAFNPS